MKKLSGNIEFLAQTGVSNKNLNKDLFILFSYGDLRVHWDKRRACGEIFPQHSDFILHLNRVFNK